MIRSMLTNDSSEIEVDPVDKIKFAVLMTLQVPSLIISLIIFVHFCTNREVRSDDHQHSIFVLLATNFLQVLTESPIPMNFYRSGGVVQPSTDAYCTWWGFYEFTLLAINSFLMAWISIERHLLIFHNHLFRNVHSWKRWSVHVAPLVFCIVWPPVIYLITVVISPMCTKMWNYNSLLCGQPCYLLTAWGSFDLLLDVVFPVVVILFMNIALVVRVIYQKMTSPGRMQVSWRNQQKMVLQLGTISAIYLAAWLPLSIAELGEIYIEQSFLLDQLGDINFLVYIVPMVTPMVCLLAMPKLLRKIKTIFLRRRNNAVVPSVVTIRKEQQVMKVASPPS